MTDRQTLLTLADFIEERIKDYEASVGPSYNSIDVAADRDVISILRTFADSTEKAPEGDR